MKKRVCRLFALAAITSLAACSASGHASSPVARVGLAAPQWTERTSAGTELSLQSLRGKPIYLNFFATWCPPCNEEAPDINALQKRYAGRGLQTVGVDELENAKKAAQFVHKYGLVYPAVVDDGTLQTQYSVNGLPVHVFIDRSGVIRKMVTGEMSEKAIAAAIQSIL
ncbi:MAG TPA: TlpA disulfide reductase family protein [Candidatus Baltobacteraceae bacterium]|nr:TlpA disulfide reductase family protein [Candidatus Baltobacteraceae bacterium]